MYSAFNLYLNFVIDYSMDSTNVNDKTPYQFVARRDSLTTEKLLQHGYWSLQGHVIYLLYIYNHDQGGNEMENIMYLVRS